MTESKKYESPLKSAICEFKKKAITIKKETENPFFKKNYADLATILDAIEVKAAECGIVIFSQLVKDDGLMLRTTIEHKDGAETIASTFPVFGNKPQEIGSSISYARRYNIQSLLNLVAEDDDGNNANQAAPVKPAAKPVVKTVELSHNIDVGAIESMINTVSDMAGLISVWDSYKAELATLKATDHKAYDKLVWAKDTKKTTLGA